jgi:hypothetical protein
MTVYDIYIYICIYIYCIYVYIYIYIYMYMLPCYKNIIRKMEAQEIFLNPFTACSLCKRKFVICLFVDKERNGSYPFAKKD